MANLANLWIEGMKDPHHLPNIRHGNQQRIANPLWNHTKNSCFHGIYCDKIACTPYMSSYTAIYWDIQLYAHKYLYILVHTSIYPRILIYTLTYSYILTYTSIYSYILWYTDIYYFNPAYTRIYVHVLCISVYIRLNTSPRDFPWDFLRDFHLRTCTFLEI